MESNRQRMTNPMCFFLICETHTFSIFKLLTWLITTTRFVHSCLRMSSRQHIIVDKELLAGSVLTLLFWECTESLHQRHKNTGVKPLCRHQVNISIFNKLYKCYLQQWALLSLCGEQSIVLATACVAWGFPCCPHDNKSVKIKHSPWTRSFV